VKSKHWFILYVLIEQFWLLSLLNTPFYLSKQGYISDLFIRPGYEALLYRILAIVSGIILLIFARTLHVNRSNKWYGRAVLTTKSLAVLTIIDAVFVDTCSSLIDKCQLVGMSYVSSFIHGIESIISVGLVFLLCAFIYKSRTVSRVQIVTCALLLAVILIAQLVSSQLEADKGLWQRLFTICAVIPFYYLLPRDRSSPRHLRES